MPERAYIGIGSNLGDRSAYLHSGLATLSALVGVEPDALSSIYETAPEDYLDQPSFLNAVFSLQTELKPEQLLHAMHQVEDSHGRLRTIHWGSRSLDLDLLLCGGCRIDSPELILPHPRLTTRSFVLVPLCETAPELCHPCTGKSFKSYCDELESTQQVRKVGAFGPARVRTRAGA